MPGVVQHERTHAFPWATPPKRMRYKGGIRGNMRKIGGLNRPEERLDGHSPAGHEEDKAEKFPSNQ
jgi:hypothetical protein